MVRLQSDGDIRHRSAISAMLIGITAVVVIGTASTPALAQRQGFNLGPKDAVTTPYEINLIADAGGDMVRFPCHFWANSDVWYWLNLADAAQQTCERRGMVLVIAFQMSGDVFNTQQGQDNFVWAWQRFAERFSGRQGRIYFELANEPTHPAWRDIALRAAQAIRRLDTRHAIAFSPRGTTTDPAATITPLPGISNQVLTFHFYDWLSDVQRFDPNFPDQPLPNPAPYPSPSRTKDDLRQRLRRVADAGARHNVPVYISEVAIPRWHPNAPRFLRDFTAACDDFGIHLTVHAFREADVWNYEPTAAWSVLTAWLTR